MWEPEGTGEERFVGNIVHRTAVIEDGVEMGQGNYIGPFTYIGPNVIMGSDNRFEGHCSIGTPAEHKDHFKVHGVTHIGSRNHVREFVTINCGTTGITKMGDDCIMLRGSHLSHDSILENDVTLSCNVLIGGHSLVMRGANLGLGAILHQYQVIGSYAMLGMGTVVPKKKHIIPGYTYVGNPARELGKNVVGLQRHGITSERLTEEMQRWTALRKS